LHPYFVAATIATRPSPSLQVVHHIVQRDVRRFSVPSARLIEASGIIDGGSTCSTEAWQSRLVVQPLWPPSLRPGQTSRRRGTLRLMCSSPVNCSRAPT